jgi:hypothetical protein
MSNDGSLVGCGGRRRWRPAELKVSGWIGVKGLWLLGKGAPLPAVLEEVTRAAVGPAMVAVVGSEDGCGGTAGRVGEDPRWVVPTTGTNGGSC